MAPKRSSRGSSPAPRPPRAKEDPKPTRSPKAKHSGGPGKMSAVGSEGDLEALDDASPGTPLNSGSRVHAWVRIHAGKTSGVELHDEVTVKTEPVEEYTNVYATDSAGRRHANATVDGVVPADAQVRSVESELLHPLCDAILDKPDHKLAALLCYGDDDAGRGEALFGEDKLVAGAVNRLCSNCGAGQMVQVAGVVITCELLVDLLNPSGEVWINETLSSGLHFAGVTWSTAVPGSALSGLISKLKTSREQVMAKQGGGLTMRCSTVVCVRYAPTDDSLTSYGNTLHLVELAQPPIAKAFGGLSLDDYCSVNTSLKTLTKCLTAMGSRKKAHTPPLRDSMLTHLLALCLGDDTAPVHCLVYVPARRAAHAEAVQALNWAGKATAARLKKGVYTSGSCKAMVAQLQGVVASIDDVEEAQDDIVAEMREQMTPAPESVDALAKTIDSKKATARDVASGLGKDEPRLKEQLAANASAAEKRKAEQEVIRTEVADLKHQVEGVRSGNRLNEATEKLKQTITDEKRTMRKDLAEMESRLIEAQDKLDTLGQDTGKLLNGAPDRCEALVAQGMAYADKGKTMYASLVFMSAVKLMECAGLGRDKCVVPAVSMLADLFATEGLDEEAISLYKQAYSIEKDACGADSPELAKHLQKLGSAYEKQGKMEAATLTLEEAGSVLEHAYGPEHPEVLALREQLARLIEPDLDPDGDAEDEDEDEDGKELLTSRQIDWSGEALPEAEDAKGKKKVGAKPKTKKPKAKGKKSSKSADASSLDLDRHGKAKGSIAVDATDESAVQKFSSQRMRARLEARQRRLAEEGGQHSLGSAPSLPPPLEVPSGDSPMSELLIRKRELFRQRMAKRKMLGEANEPASAEKERRSSLGEDAVEDDDSADESDASLEADDFGDSSEVAMIESQVIEIIASAHGAAQREDWSEVLDLSSQLEDRLARTKGKVAACATAARVLLNTGLKHASGFSDEPRVRSTLGCLMLIEWCVPTCPDAFRQAIAGERWVRKLVDLCRKDSTELSLVRNTVMQLIANWVDWYGTDPACAGFEKAGDMLADAGFDLPEAARRDPAPGKSGGPLPPSATSPNAAGVDVPDLQLQLHLGRPSETPSYLGTSATSGDAASKVEDELDIMREDVNTLEEALDRCGAMTWRGGESSAKLSATELADAAQAATDTRGWRSRLAALIEKHDRKKQQEEIRAGKSIDMSLVLPEFLLDEMVTLLRQMDELLARYLASAPVEKRNRLNAERGSDVVNAKEIMSLGVLEGITLPTPRGTAQSDGPPTRQAGPPVHVSTPRNPTHFVHNPKLLNARGPLTMPPELQAQLSARGLQSLDTNQLQAALGINSPRVSRPQTAQPRQMSPGSELKSIQEDSDDPLASSRKPGSPELEYGDRPVPTFSLKLPIPGQENVPSAFGPPEGVPELFGSGSFAEDSAYGWADPDDQNSALDAQLQELSGLLGGDADQAPQFLQEMLMLQMQAEAWRMQWSVAMQENEELRAKLYDTRNSLEAAGGGGAGGEHWRELCISIAKSAEEEKGQVLEQIGTMTDEVVRTTGVLDARQAELERLKEAADVDRASADDWSARANSVIKARNELNAALYNADFTAAEMEADAETQQYTHEEKKMRTIELQQEAEALNERSREEEAIYEATLTEVYASHRASVDNSNLELTANEEDLTQVSAAMNQWRTQWEEELTEKNSIDAELLTLRSEFEKSSATYDREIEGLKELLEKERLLREEMSLALQGEEGELGAFQTQLDASRGELSVMSEVSQSQQSNTGDFEKEYADCKAADARDRDRYEEGLLRAQKADAQSEAMRAALNDVSGHGAILTNLKNELKKASVEAAKYEELEKRLRDTEQRKHQLIAEADALRTQANSMADTAVSEQSGLTEALSEARSAAAKWEQEHSVQLATKTTLLEEVNSLKIEAKELTDAHGREVERLNERLGKLERAHDSLDGTLAEEQGVFDTEMNAKREAFEAKVRQQEEQVAELVAQQEDVRAQLAEVRTLLTQEQRERQTSEDSMRDIREMAEAKIADAEEREKRLEGALEDLQGERKHIEAKAADERRKVEDLLEQLGGDQAEANRKTKEADERAVEFEKQWVAESKLRKELHNQLEELVGNLRVYCRVRPQIEREAESEICVTVKGSDQVIIKDHDDDRRDKKHFMFTQVYGEKSTQEELFKDTNTLMTSVLDGYNVCLFAYGQSGSGKTFTMNGDDAHPGLVPRAMESIFEMVGERETNYKHDCFISMIEIYNESIRDLLRDPKADASKIKYDIMRDNLVGMYVKDLTSEQVHTASHAKRIIEAGNRNRVTAATGLNDQSSRSHMVVTLTVRTLQHKGGDHYVGKLSLVDLAGSERLAKSQTTGQAQKETTAINKSLSALGTVIASLATGDKHVPYRDSKLTYLLQDSLGGNSKTLMFVNIGPAQSNCGENINSLNFATRAKTVALGKATKNREDIVPGGDEKVGKASTVMAAANKMSNMSNDDSVANAPAASSPHVREASPQPHSPAPRKSIGSKKKSREAKG